MLCVLLFFSCEEKLRITVKIPKKINIHQPLQIEVYAKEKKLDSVWIYLDGQKISNKNKITLDISLKKLGKHSITARGFYQNKMQKTHQTIYFLASKKPQIFSYKVIKTYPHDATAFTQGFEYHKGFLYESTGKKGKSSIRKTNLVSGDILQVKWLEKSYFGEGITIFKNKIYQLTWQANKGFVYDLKSFKRLQSFSYKKSKQGWGLTHNKTHLIKTDGSERIWFLNPQTFEETGYIEAYTDKRKVEKLNEIEYIEGKIYANIWQKNTIVIINAKNGAIEAVVNLKGLTKYLSSKKLNADEVLNGIAYDNENKRLLVTGKHWSKTFEIEIVKK